MSTIPNADMHALRTAQALTNTDFSKKVDDAGAKVYLRVATVGDKKVLIATKLSFLERAEAALGYGDASLATVRKFLASPEGKAQLETMKKVIDNPEVKKLMMQNINIIQNKQSTLEKFSESIGRATTGVIEAVTRSPAKRAEELGEVLSLYNNAYKPGRNEANLKEYIQSKDYERHAASAKVYFNQGQMAKSDAAKAIFQREPTNISATQMYDKKKLQEKYGYEASAYNDTSVTKADGTSFKELPNTAAVYSETYMWDTRDKTNGKREVACLSLPAPALDSPTQPHFSYYVQNGKLDTEKYAGEMEFLFKTVEQALRDNQKSAFEGKGIQRAVLSKFGQGAFVKGMSEDQQKIANDIFRAKMAEFLENVKDTGVEVVLSEFKHPSELTPPQEVWHEPMIIGSIDDVAKEGDLIINAWDPHTAPGNGNDFDPTFDGKMGETTGILTSQSAWLNNNLKDPKNFVGITT